MKKYKLSEYLNKNDILLDVNGNQYQDIVKRLVQFIGKRYDDVEKHHDRIIQEIINREEKGSTCIEEVIAIPHCKTNLVQSTRIAIGVSKQGIKWSDHSHCETFFFLLSISPLSNQRNHIGLLQAIHEVCHRKTVIDLIKEAKSKEEVYSILTKY